MRQDPQRSCQKALHMSPMAVAQDSRWMLQQLALPVEPTDTIKARRERAIRRAGISPAKGIRIWYGQACAILAHEYLQIKAAVKKAALQQEDALERELDHLRQLRMRVNQDEFMGLDAALLDGASQADRYETANQASGTQTSSVEASTT